MLRYLSLDIICSSKLTVFLELRSRKTVRLLEQIMSADKYLCIFLWTVLDTLFFPCWEFTRAYVLFWLHFISGSIYSTRHRCGTYAIQLSILFTCRHLAGSNKIIFIRMSWRRRMKVHISAPNGGYCLYVY